MSTDTLNFDLQKTIRLLPGYDPFAQAGDCTFDEETAAFAIAFIEECCTFTKGGEWAGKPFILQDWQKAIVANLWGWKQPDGLRRYRECLLFVPRKNGKSELAAAIIILAGYAAAGLLVGQPPEPGAEIYGAAGKRDQTKYIFDPVKRMILREPWLNDRAEVSAHSIVIGDVMSGAVYHKISSEATTEHGGSTYLAVVDELHAQPTGELVEVLQTSMGSREQPLLLHVTTSDYEREGSVCNTKHKYASQVRDNGGDPGKPGYDPSFLPVIYEASREDDWTSPGVWRRANPNIDVTIKESFIARECRRAQEEPEYENTFKRLHLNIRTTTAFRWMPMLKWDACDGEIDLDRLKGQPCWAGLDLASVSDMASLVLAFPVDDEFWLLPFFWCPEDTAAIRERKERQPYVTWSKKDLVELTPGNAVDYRYIRKRINKLGEDYKFREIAFDPYNATMLAQQLADEDGFEMVEHRQGTVSMNEPMNQFMRLVLQQRIRHGGHPVLRWNATNIAAVRGPSDDIRPDKKNSADKIDGIVAAIMAVGRAWRQEGATESPYNERGFLTT